MQDTDSSNSCKPITKVSPYFSPSYVWYSVLLLALVNAVNYMDRMALSVLLPFIKEDLQLSDTQLGILTGFAFAFFYAAFGVPIARWADRSSRRNIIAMAMTLWSAMTVVSGFAQNFSHMFWSRVGVGVGEAGCIAPSQSMISDYVPVERRSGMLALYAGGSTVGIVLGLSLASWLAAQYGWRITFMLLGLPGLILAVIVRLTLVDPPRGHSDGLPLAASTDSIVTVVLRLMKGRAYVNLIAFLSISGFVNFGINQWSPSFFVRSFGLDIERVGLLFGLALGLGSTIGLVGGGFWSNHLSKRSVGLPLWIGVACIALAMPITCAIFFVSSSTTAFALCFFSQLFWSIPGGAIFSAAQSVVKPNIRATSSAVMIVFVSVIGFGVGPFVVGLLSDHLNQHYGDESLRYALLSITILMPLMVVALYRAADAFPADLAAMTGEKSLSAIDDSDL